MNHQGNDNNRNIFGGLMMSGKAKPLFREREKKTNLKMINESNI